MVVLRETIVFDDRPDVLNFPAIGRTYVR